MKLRLANVITVQDGSGTAGGSRDRSRGSGDAKRPAKLDHLTRPNRLTAGTQFGSELVTRGAES